MDFPKNEQKKKLGTHEKYGLAEGVAYQLNTFKKGMLNVSREENTFHKERQKATKAVVKEGLNLCFLRKMCHSLAFSSLHTLGLVIWFSTGTRS